MIIQSQRETKNWIKINTLTIAPSGKVAYGSCNLNGQKIKWQFRTFNTNLIPLLKVEMEMDINGDFTLALDTYKDKQGITRYNTTIVINGALIMEKDTQVDIDKLLNDNGEKVDWEKM